MVSWSEGSLASLEDELCRGETRVKVAQVGVGKIWVRGGSAGGQGDPTFQEPRKGPGAEVFDLRAECRPPRLLVPPQTAAFQGPK